MSERGGPLKPEPNPKPWEFGKALQAAFGRLLLALVLLPASGWSDAKEASHPVILRGILHSLAGKGVDLQTKKKDYALTARTTWLLHTLEDKRLANREVQVQGIIEPDGALKVDRFSTIRNGKLYRVRYFCEVCNIEALEPGPCACCQQPTELQEIPQR